jgi:hypothetical protein
MIPRRIHAIIDYLVGVSLVLAPFVLGFADGGNAQWVTIGFGLVAVLYSLLTDYELGLVGLFSYRNHLVVDILFALALIAAPWALAFHETVWWPHFAVGVTGLLVVALSWRARA